ncbi:MAG: permease of phosphate ABC transporter [Oscillospiraceae bacterium]|nr:permease of phosphate ABC transporter [Oscillospiraceae bacterium]
MNKFLEAGKSYLAEMNLADMALLKFCLCAVGVVLGLCVPKKAQKPVLVVTVLVFLATYVPLMIKFIRVLGGRAEEEKE